MKPVERKIYTVSELNNLSRQLLENNIGRRWISGEISNLTSASSGHIYFNLKDSAAMVRCALFRQNGRLLNFSLKNGLQVLVFGQISLYETRGDYQLIVQTVEQSGDGLLQKAFAELKKRLNEAGLFAADKKKPLPILPATIGIITSPTGAALHDILTVLKRRFPAIPIIIYPTLVQGEKAADQIVKALETANSRNECEVLILARGGGSMEDLWSFNEEKVAFAIFNSKIPIITGVGHEVDFTIADFVADVRAPTPSAAAETVAPNYLDWLNQFKNLFNRLTHLQVAYLKQAQIQLNHLQKRLRHPGQRLQEQAQRLDELEYRLLTAIQHDFKHRHALLNRMNLHWQHVTPLIKVEKELSHLRTQKQRLMTLMQHQLELPHQRLQKAAAALHALSPLNTLKRGYAIVYEHQSENVVAEMSQLQIGMKLDVKLTDGDFECEVKQIQSYLTAIS